ncbi:MAG: alpha-galactosidase [Verrucomicrobiota bacterium]
MNSNEQLSSRPKLFKRAALFLFVAAWVVGNSSLAETFQFKSCYARWSDDGLVLGNSHFERTWRIQGGLLIATSFRNLQTGTEWIRQPATHPAPVMPDWRAAAAAGVSFAACSGRLCVTEEESLQVWVTAKRDTNLVCRFRVFPEASGVETFFDVNSAALQPESAAVSKLSATSADGVEADVGKLAEGASDSLENLLLSPQHLRLTQVNLMDQTDIHNELVQENEWMLLNERNLELPGNLFVLENPTNGEGLVFVKLAPLPHSRPVKSAFDCQVNARERQVRFTGQGYPFTLLAYSGGSAGRTAVLQDFQRQLRRYQPDRDGLFLSNTWGDRSRDARVTEEFLLKEIEAGARLGVDVIQIDDGWQNGRTANSSNPKNGAWESFWSASADFWQPNAQRFPHGLKPVAEAVHAHGMKFGLWFGPDSAGGCTNWNRDAKRLLQLHRKEGVNYFKLDSVKLTSTTAVKNFRSMVDRLLAESDGNITVDLDVTAGTRPGYFGIPQCGPVFVENRYTDWQNYWPHLTLRNLWKLSHYVYPVRLRMEFLNNARNTALYGNDPLAPARYSPDTLFATVMFASPLGWFEVSNLPEHYQKSVAELVSVWKREREQLFSGHILPIGEVPDGQCWTGFASVSKDGKSSYVLIFREQSLSAEWSLDLKMFSGGQKRITKLAGKGEAAISGNTLSVQIPEPLQYLWLRVE